MSSPQTQPVAQGTLANTPFAHLVLYIYQRRSSGTLVVRDPVGGPANQRAGSTDEPAAVLFHRGRAVAARVGAPADALDQALLPLCSLRDAVYEFFEDDLVGSGAAIVTGMFDPYAFVTEAARRYTRDDVVEAVLVRFSELPLCVQPGMDLDRLLLSSQESSFAEVLRDGTATIRTLLASRKLPERLARRVLYALLVTKVVGTYAPANDTRPGASSGAPEGLPAGKSSDAPSSSQSSNLSPEQRRRKSSAAWQAIAARAQQVSRPISGPLPPPGPGARSMTPPARTASRPLTPPPGAAVRSPTPQPHAARSPTPAAGRSLSPPGGSARSVTPSGSFNVRRSPTPPERPTPPPGRVISGQPLEAGPVAPPSGTPRVTTPSRPISRVTPRPNSEPVESLDSAGKFRRVEALVARNAFDEALPIIRALVEAERRNPAYLGLLASVLYGQGIEGTISKEIVDTVNQALRIHPDEVNALYTKARCYKRMGKNREALHYFKRTASVDPAHLEAQREVRLLMLRQNDTTKKG
jgi:hypothetical protein